MTIPPKSITHLKMATKSNKKTQKGKELKPSDKDNLDLRDEILDLKREIASLRKDRDKLAIRLRKAEDECRKKDRQIDQLMDPSENAEIRELLSMKGAAMLLNLRDQNNTLVQMLMEKNMQIKRLGNEIKTAQLYAKTKKTEPYRMEISRLRNLLIQSQEALKEAAQAPQLSCISQQSRTSTSSSTDTPTSQELEELRFMVQSLETHMQYSKELLRKKNQEIATLSRELAWPQFKVNSGRIFEETRNYEETRRCASAPALDPFQQAFSEKSTRPLSPRNLPAHGKEETKNSKNKRKSIDFILQETQAPNSDVIATRDDPKHFTRQQNKTPEPGKKMSPSEKWKFAYHVINGKILHTNPNADDEQVWNIINSDVCSSGNVIKSPAKKMQISGILREKSFTVPSEIIVEEEKICASDSNFERFDGAENFDCSDSDDDDVITI